MSDPAESSPADERLRRLSCLLDGDFHEMRAEEVSLRWHDDAELRLRWHRYHLIGDVMRSQELASSPERDARFLDRMRERLASEPPLLAPASGLPLRVARRTAPRWLAPAAVAAGFVAVAGVLVVARELPMECSASSLATATPVQAEALRRASVAASGTPLARGTEFDAAMVRDAEIDRYFRAHRDMRLNPAAALPGGAPRTVDAIVQQR